MPYNNSTIPPPDEITGTSCLPLARVRKIIAQDEDIALCSTGAAFAISVATEIFIRYLTEQAHNVVKAERKPRRNLQYKDFASAVSRIDNLDFLADVIPKTTTYKRFKEIKARDEAAAAASMTAGTPLRSGQTSLQNGFDNSFASTHRNEAGEGSSRPGSNGVLLTPKLPSVNGSPMADRTLTSLVHSYPCQTTDGDVEMEDEELQST